jgi:hypothetical protein
MLTARGGLGHELALPPCSARKETEYAITLTFSIV